MERDRFFERAVARKVARVFEYSFQKKNKLSKKRKKY